MKLDYCILWFEDQPDQIINLKKAMQDFLWNSGFRLKANIQNHVSQKELDKLSDDLQKYNPYDLIIFDHDLGVDGTGARIAKNLRHSVYTDMVYYSGNSSVKLREELYREEIDGVFIVNRNDFVISIERILEDHINKFSDMNNIRGVFLDAFSKIEQYARHYLCQKISSLTIEQRKKIKDKMLKYHNEKIGERQKTKDSLNENTIYDHFYDTRLVDFEIVRRRICQLEGGDSIWGNGNLIHQMQQLRNIFAHRSYRFDSKTNTVIIDIDSQEQHFDIVKFREIRQKLLEISTVLNLE